MPLFVINRSMKDAISDSYNIASNIINFNSIINCYGCRKEVMVYSEKTAWHFTWTTEEARE